MGEGTERAPLSAEDVHKSHRAAMRALADVTHRRKWAESRYGSPVAVLALCEEIARLHRDPSTLLWCCHVRGPDDVHAAPDYQTALAWSDRINDWFAAQPRRENDPIIRAAPAIWPYGAETHAVDLPKCVSQFADGRLP